MYSVQQQYDFILRGGMLLDGTLGDFLDVVEKRGSAANFCSYIGSGAVRAYVVGYDDRPARKLSSSDGKSEPEARLSRQSKWPPELPRDPGR